MCCQKPYEHHIDFSNPDYYEPFRGIGNVVLPCKIVEHRDPLRFATLIARAAYPANVKQWRNVRRENRLKKARLEKLRWERHDRLKALARDRRMYELSRTITKLVHRVGEAIVEAVEPAYSLFNLFDVLDYEYSEGEADPGGCLLEMEYTDGEWVDE